MLWQYCWGHSVYHLTRWFPRNNRLKIRIVMMIFTIALLIPQFFVLAEPHTERFCGQHLFEFLVVSIVYTFCMIGFSFIFSLMDPVPWEVKFAFHIFGVITFVTGIVFTFFTSMAAECKVTTPELYYFSLAAVVITVVSLVFFAIVLPFWVINWWCVNSVLDYKNRDGICYEPANCCSCVWHI
ncbi:hypothetical protein NP493_283g04011 [Ridgeia piscesae]|uniref:Uncharacterized protein n=1 Tax=Ridgeia piscesae TaxID=27915 RepID=A0AAD9NX70_RIDPI|nr:hypothetical protein NP493_283g04011 [Ridgeia piscesae]